MKQFDHMIERKLNPRLKFLAGCGQFSDFSNIVFIFVISQYLFIVTVSNITTSLKSKIRTKDITGYNAQLKVLL
jgi:hypothetical protein